MKQSHGFGNSRRRYYSGYCSDCGWGFTEGLLAVANFCPRCGNRVQKPAKKGQAHHLIGKVTRIERRKDFKESALQFAKGHPIVSGVGVALGGGTAILVAPTLATAGTAVLGGGILLLVGALVVGGVGFSGRNRRELDKLLGRGAGLGCVLVLVGGAMSVASAVLAAGGTVLLLAGGMVAVAGTARELYLREHKAARLQSAANTLLNGIRKHFPGVKSDAGNGPNNS